MLPRENLRMLLGMKMLPYDNIIYDSFSADISKSDKTSAWNYIEETFTCSLLSNQNADEYGHEKLKKWENILQKIPTYIKAKEKHQSSTGREPFRENEELERALDVVGRDNPKYFKPDFAMSSTSFMDQLTEELETTAEAPTQNPTMSSDFSTVQESENCNG